ncbi:MAG: ROK family protein [Elusimicrobia bacterium]|nr:ROK family protein [Elusimicrobiota bacterium]
MENCFLGIDVGGTLCKLVALSPEGTLLRQVGFPTQPSKGAYQFLQKLSEAAQELLAKPQPLSAQGVGVGIAGDVDSQGGTLRFSPNLKGWRNLPIRETLSKHLGLPVLVDNDANLAAWGAYATELQHQPQNLLTVTLGTGVGGGLILNGEIFRGKKGTAGEIGHMTVERNGRPCLCGNRGCLEQYVGARGLVREAKKRMRRKPSRILKDLLKIKRESLSPEILAEAARCGDPLARELWQEAGSYLGSALASVINLLNLDWVLLTGGVSRAGKLLLKPIHRTVWQSAFHTPSRHVKIRIARSKHLGVLGAGLYAIQQFGGSGTP